MEVCEMDLMTDRSDTDLAHLAKAGDMDAFSVLFSRHRGWVFRKAYRMFHSHEDAEDAVNDVFFKMWQNLQQWKGEQAGFGAWFGALCSNTLIDIRRGHRAKKRQIHRLASETELQRLDCQADVTQKDPLTSMVEAELMIKIEDALCEMSETHCRQRLAWILYYLEEYPYRDVARILKVTPNTARAHAHRCTKRLRKLLQR